MLLFLPLAVAWLLVAAGALALAVALTVAALAVITPWTLRNLRVHERFVLVASEGGVTFWTGNHPLARGEGDLAANPELKKAELALRQAHPGAHPKELEPIYYREAHRLDRASTRCAGCGCVARKAFYTVVPIGPSYALHSRADTAWRRSVPYLLVLPFAVAGARRLWRSPRRPVSLLLLGGVVDSCRPRLFSPGAIPHPRHRPAC